MPAYLLVRLVFVRLLAISFLLVVAYAGLAAIDFLFGTSAIVVIWQWLGKFWLFVLKWLKIMLRVILRWLPGVAKRFVFRKGMSGFSKIATTGLLALVFAWLGGDRYARLAKAIQRHKSGGVRLALLIWSAEVWFLPKWFRAGLFIAAVIASIFAFVGIQDWAEARNSPEFLGIDPWSFLFGLLASFVLTNLPLIGFDHFLAIIFRPLQHRYRRFIRRKGLGYVVVNWFIALRPARRWAELERKLFMRRWRRQNNSPAKN